MDVQVEDLGPTRKRIHVIVPEEMVKKEIDGVYNELKRTAKVKGFRPGKTPRQILERYYGDYVTEQVISKIIGNTYEGALSEGGIRPVSRPTLENEELTAGNPFKYSAVVDVNPEIDVKDYTGVSVRKRELKVEKDDVAKRLEQLQNLHAQLKTIGEDSVRSVSDSGSTVSDSVCDVSDPARSVSISVCVVSDSASSGPASPGPGWSDSVSLSQPATIGITRPININWL